MRVIAGIAGAIMHRNGSKHLADRSDSPHIGSGFVIPDELSALIETLDEYDVSNKSYSILLAMDHTVCISYGDDGWETFFQQEDERQCVQRHTNVDEACKCLLDIFSGDRQELRQMIKTYEAHKTCMKAS